MKKIKIGILSLFIGLFFIACGEDSVQNELDFAELTQDEKITLKSVNGGEKTLIRTKSGFIVEGEEDKILMLDFFGTFCQPCKDEAFELTKLWQKNAQNLTLIGLDHFEEVSDEEVLKFAKDYNAFYFLSNSKENKRIILQILKDISYQNMEQLPFKVLLKNGEYQTVSDFWNNDKKVKFYLGKIPSAFIQKDLDRIIGTSNAKK